MLELKEIVKGNTARLAYYAEETLWYEVYNPITQSVIFKFPVPIEDVKGTVTMAHYNAIQLMRWIRKHRDYLIKEAANAREAAKA